MFSTFLCFIQLLQDEKKSLKKSADKDAALLLKSSLNISLVKESEEDVRLAGLLKYHTVQCKFTFPIISLIYC